jgi:hypothetical protein
MKFGPFTDSHIEQIQGVLTGLGVHFQVQIDPAAIDSWRMEVLDQPPSRHPEAKRLLEGLYLEIDDADLARIGDRLEKFGVKGTDGTEWELSGPEEYYCERCDYSSTDHGLCPRHRAPLITMREKLERKQKRDSGWTPGKIAAVAVLILFAIWIFTNVMPRLSLSRALFE